MLVIAESDFADDAVAVNRKGAAAACHYCEASETVKDPSGSPGFRGDSPCKRLLAQESSEILKQQLQGVSKLASGLPGQRRKHFLGVEGFGTSRMKAFLRLLMLCVSGSRTHRVN